MKQRVLIILWPAFVMAGVLEMLVFAFADPLDLHSLSGAAIPWPPQAIYSVAFFVFWAVIAAASAMTLWLAAPDANPAQEGLVRSPPAAPPENQAAP